MTIIRTQPSARTVRVASGPKGDTGATGQPRSFIDRLGNTLTQRDAVQELGYIADDPVNGRTVRDPGHVDVRVYLRAAGIDPANWATADCSAPLLAADADAVAAGIPLRIVGAINQGSAPITFDSLVDFVSGDGSFVGTGAITYVRLPHRTGGAATVVDRAGTTLTQREQLQVIGARASDDSVNGRTKIDLGRSYLSEFGAVGDGVADDTAAVLAWITDQLTTGREGVAPAGTFSIDTVHFPSIFTTGQGLRIRGAGMHKTTFMSRLGNDIWDIGNTAFNHSVLTDFGFDGGIPQDALGRPIGFAQKVYTADATTDTLTSTGHGYSNGQRVVVATTGTHPGGLNWYVTYYVISATTDTFKLSNTSGGAAIDITSAGTGTLKVGAINGTGSGIYMHPGQATGLFNWRNLWFQNFGRSGVRSPDIMFSCHLDAINVHNCFGDGIDIYGGGQNTFTNCYWHAVPTALTYGIHFWAGTPIFCGCNGIDGSGAGGGGWGRFGADVATDGVVAVCNPTFIAANFEAISATTPGVRTMTNCNPVFVGSNKWQVYTDQVDCVGLLIDYASGGYIDHGSTFVLGVGSTWKNGCAIHVGLGGGTPPVIRGTIVDESSTEITNYRDDGNAATYLLPVESLSFSNSVWGASFKALFLTGPVADSVQNFGVIGSLTVTSFTWFSFYGNKQSLQLGTALAVPLAINGGNYKEGSRVELMVKQSTAGGKSISWDTNFHFPAGVNSDVDATANSVNMWEFDVWNVAGLPHLYCVGSARGL